MPESYTLTESPGKIKSAYAIFGYHHVNSKTEKFKIISVKIGDKQYDYALAKLAPKKINRQKIYPGNKYGILKLGLYLPKIEEQLYLVGHPKGKPKAYSETACEMIKYSKFAMIHTCDTKPGSSGSPILNRFMEVVGLHASGINIRSSPYQRSNKAYRIDYIWQLFGGYAAAAEKYMYNTLGTTYRKNIFVNSLNNQYFK